MIARFCCFLVLFFLCLVGATSRLLATNDGFALNNNPGTVQNILSLKINQTTNEVKKSVEETSKTRVVINKIGSGPPSCEHKCYGCMPCEAIQVPTTTSRVKVLYTNYEPEDWKCNVALPFTAPNKRLYSI